MVYSVVFWILLFFIIRRIASDPTTEPEPIIVGMSNEDRGIIETGIRDKLMSQLRPMYLDVINQSVMYEHPESSEKFFAIVIVSTAFIGSTNYQRHLLVNGILEKELANDVEGLAIVAKTPEEWRQEKYSTPNPELFPHNDIAISW